MGLVILSENPLSSVPLLVLNFPDDFHHSFLGSWRDSESNFEFPFISNVIDASTFVRGEMRWGRVTATF